MTQTRNAAIGGSTIDSFEPSLVSGILAGSHVLPFAVTSKGTVVFANPAFAAKFGRTGGDVIGRMLTDLVELGERPDLAALLLDSEETPITVTVRALGPGGHAFDVEFVLAREILGGIVTTCVFAHDVSKHRKAERRLTSLAFTDMLTGLPNRACIMDRLGNALIDARCAGGSLALFMADMDGLKRANDTYGHQAGDVVLQTAARRFASCIREADTLARLGGDEFCVLLSVIGSADDAEAIGVRLVEAIRQPVAFDDHEIHVGVSVGIAVFPAHGATGDDLFAAADAALYEAKRGGKGRVVMASKPAPRGMASLPLITWAAVHNVGIEMMDRQHRQLTVHVNRLAAALRSGDDPDEVFAALSETLSYAVHHFDSEEKLMDTYSYAGARNHTEEHRHLLDDLRTFAIGRDTRSLSLTTRFLQEWLLRHIDGEDRAMADALKAAGVR
jgi:diguanylate cyclase (GGDEF)-like protein/hemerythrin-like metal-binding protein/PAS domain S-box-containing protein